MEDGGWEWTADAELPITSPSTVLEYSARPGFPPTSPLSPSLFPGLALNFYPSLSCWVSNFGQDLPGRGEGQSRLVAAAPNSAVWWQERPAIWQQFRGQLVSVVEFGQELWPLCLLSRSLQITSYLVAVMVYSAMAQAAFEVSRVAHVTPLFLKLLVCFRCNSRCCLSPLKPFTVHGFRLLKELSHPNLIGFPHLCQQRRHVVGPIGQGIVPFGTSCPPE